MSAFHIRTAQAHDMDYIIGLLAKAGWNPGLHDAQCFFASDPQGFLIAHLGAAKFMVLGKGCMP